MRAVVGWFRRVRHPAAKLLLHVPNECSGRVSRRTLLDRAKDGVVGGVSDLFLPWPVTGPDGKRYSGLWIEMKVGAGILSDSQKGWLLAMREAGYAAEVAYGTDEAIGIIKAYLGLK